MRLHLARHRLGIHPHHRRGVALLLVTLATFIAAAVAYNYLAAQSTSIVLARNSRDDAQARAIAESCMDYALSFIRTNSSWRTMESNGLWTSDAVIHGGTCTVSGEDGRDSNGDRIISVPSEGDGNISPSTGYDDLLTLTVVGQHKTARHVVRAVVTPGTPPVSGQWQFDETSGTSVSDSGVNNLDGTINNASPPQWTTGKVNNGLRFTNDTSYVSIPDSAAGDLGQSGTLSMWFKMDTFKPFAGLIHKGSQASFADEAYTLQFWNTNKLYFGLNGTSTSATLSSGTSISNNAWYHVVATWDSSGMKMYLNGTLNCSNTQAITAKNSAGALMLGAQLPVSYNSTYKNLSFAGTFDETVILDRAVSASEVTSLYNLNPIGGSGSAGMKVDLLF